MKSKSAYEQALTLLEFRARSVAELRRELLRRGAPPAEVDEAIARLRDQRLLDDEDFARQFARNKVLGAGASPRRIVQELSRKGIGRDVAAQALDDLREQDGVDASEGIFRVARKKWASLAKLDEPTRRRRLYAFLARRGFDPDDIRRAMQSLGEEIAAEPSS
jgi:regulatory protein